MSLSALVQAPVLIAATYRLTRLVVDDEITRPLRERVDDTWPGSRLEEAIHCHACTSVWAAAAVLAAPRPIRNILALSASVLAVQQIKELIDG